MADPLNALYREMGEVTAVARTTSHAVNNISLKLDGVDTKVDMLAAVVAAQGHLREDVARLEQTLASQAAVIDALQADKQRREGAIGVLAWASRNWPGVGIIAAIAGAMTWADKLPI